ncbi:group I truncated hemoglobin [Phycisphaera mikurensis]|uniref:Globin-like protein n=1 Tax=Phycisphaera mikurensis (strain NBRC 102666 / KCTC 22515 / FYK2301M01) TaxID=1142394 RepID=I0IBG3_PHYMF|nr:group 1 truncated hemoglobin [Phycisphaera mikurensis]MBB6442866.1 hemoglobin [Phycisphaera mikurensis]BAM02601.1 globin-like protein [Phycisphaera mikurensis NBRC 102666]
MRTTNARLLALLLLLAAAPLGGCLGGAAADAPADDAFATSGSPAADQRAEQQMARTAQVEGTEGEEDPEEAGPQPGARKSLYERLGGSAGVAAVVDDAVDRAIVDPRVNAQRKAVEAGWLTAAPPAWEPTPGAVARVKKLIAQFIATASGGPVGYDGPPIEEAFAGRRFTNLEFDAAVGSLQASMDKLGLADQEQKELLAVMETTREQVVEVR